MSGGGDQYAPVTASSGVSRKNTLSKVAKLFSAGNSTKSLTSDNSKVRKDAGKIDSPSANHLSSRKPLSPASSTSSIASTVSAISLSSNSPTAGAVPGSKIRELNDDSAASHNSSLVNLSSIYNGSSSNLASAPARFVVHADGNHEHHLKNAKRQEKLTRMIKNMATSQKVRGQAKSAVPDIMIENKGNQQRLDPPTLFAGLIKQMGSINDSERENVPFSGASHGPDKRLYTPFNGHSAEAAAPVSKKDSPCLAEKYGRCQEVLGKGSFGVVRVCHKKTTNANGKSELLYAVKEFKKRPSEPPEKYAKRLTSEFCISSSLRHTNIIMTLDLFQDAKGDYCEVMEYCAGGDLFTLIITAGKLEYLEADCFFKQLIRGVVYMHEMGVCHRDLKPENLLLTSDGTLKIIDFGNSECFKMAWERDVHLSGGVCGSSPYIAPEEYTQEEFDPRPVDIWACGVIYIAMRTGRQLWKVAQKEDQFFTKYLRKRKEKGGYEPIENLKRARCRNVIYSMLDPVAYRRINGKQILNSEWGREIKCCNDGHAIK